MTRSPAQDPPVVQKLTALRARILQLAVQGRLVPQDASDEPAAVLLARVASRRAELVRDKVLRRPKALPAIGPEDIAYPLPRGWEWARAGEAVLAVQYGHTASASHARLDGPRMLRITDIDARNRVDWSGVPWCAEPGDNGQTELAAGDIVVARTGGTVGKATLLMSVPERAVFASYLVRMRDAGVGLAPYLFTFLRSPVYWRQVAAASSGSAQPNVNGQKLAMLCVPVPPVDEQKRIVAKVDELMGAIDELEAHLRRVEVLRPKILQLAVQGELVPQDASDEAASALLERISAEHGAPSRRNPKSKAKSRPVPPVDPKAVPFSLPAGWVWTRLGELADYDAGGKVAPGEIPPEAWLLELEDIEPTTTRLLRVEYSGQRKPGSVKTRFVPGDVLYGKLRPYLKKVIVAEAPGYATTEIVAIRGLGALAPQFASLVFRSDSWNEYVSGIVKGSRMPRLGYREAVLGMVPTPPLAEQDRIVVRTNELMSAIDALQQVGEPRQ